jgi:hypothetical protein
MTNRNTLLLIAAGLSLTLGSRASTLQAQPPQPSLTPAQQQQIQNSLGPIKPPNLRIDPTKYHNQPTMPSKYTDRPPAWLEYWQNSGLLAGPLFALAVTLALAVIIFVIATIVRIFVAVCYLILALIQMFAAWVTPVRRKNGTQESQR